MNIGKILMAALAVLTFTAPAANAQEDGHKLTFMLTGASFAVSENGWFEIGCEDMDAVAINKSVSGSAIYSCARKMCTNEFYTTAELDETDVFVIDHVHNQNVADPTWLKDDYTEYEATIATSTNYATAYDYVIKRYIADCKALKDNPESKYYGSEEGKPVRILLCTHWHDGRTTYNPAIRKLADKWGFPLIEFDTNIGFSKDDVAAGEAQPSVALAHDTETINGVKYGWHPLRGTCSYIQQRMAQIFVAKASEYLGLEFPFEAKVTAVTPIVKPGEDAVAQVRFRAGSYPFGLGFEAPVAYGPALAAAADPSAVAEAPYFINLGPLDTSGRFTLAACTDADGKSAEISGEADFKVAKGSVAPSYDAYIHEAYKEKNFVTDEILQLKVGSNWSRQIFLTFPTAELADEDLERVVVRIFFESYVLATRSDDKRDINSIETLQIAGNTHTYGNTLKWNNANTYPFEPISTTTIVPGQKGSWISFDVTDWVKERLEEGAERVTFRISVLKASGMLSNFTATESTTHPETAPAMLFAVKSTTGVEANATDSIHISGNVVNNPDCRELTVADLLGRILYSGTTPAYDLSALLPGIYIITTPTQSLKYIKG